MPVTFIYRLCYVVADPLLGGWRWLQSLLSLQTLSVDVLPTAANHLPLVDRTHITLLKYHTPVPSCQLSLFCSDIDSSLLLPRLPSSEAGQRWPLIPRLRLLHRLARWKSIATFTHRTGELFLDSCSFPPVALFTLIFCHVTLWLWVSSFFFQSQSRLAD